MIPLFMSLQEGRGIDGAAPFCITILSPRRP
jgi:hypothetical protein